MNYFSEIKTKLNLTEFLDSDLGTLYFATKNFSPTVMVRHFDSRLTPNFIDSYVDMVKTSQHWIEKYTHLSSLIRVEQPTEVGLDYIIRPFHIYITSTRSYSEIENVPEIPMELEVMRHYFLKYQHYIDTKKIEMVKKILARNLLDPSPKTYFDGKKFIVVEPSVRIEEVKIWGTLGK